MFSRKYILSLVVILSAAVSSWAVCEDFEIDGTYEAAIDLPRIYFLLKNSPNEPPIEVDGAFEINYAFLDTGASGILLSRETVDIMQIDVDPNAQFVDTGVGGDEYFDVSEPLYIGTADYDSDDPYNTDIYKIYKQWRFQVKQEYADDLLGEAIDVIGVPVMAGKVAVLKPIADFNVSGEGDIEAMYFRANIVEANDANIPPTDFQVALRFEKYINPSNPENIPPLPVLAYNPMIDNVVVEHNGVSTKANLLLDTGGTISIISVARGMDLGLVDANGDPIVDYAFSIPIGGIGGTVELPGFILDKLSVPTLSGFNLVYLHARVCVHDIGILDEATGNFIILDGIFGDNFMCASMDMETWDISSTPFDNIVIDMKNGLLGFDVNPAYPLPVCRFTDLNSDCAVNNTDLQILCQNWLRLDCNEQNGFCGGADIDEGGAVDNGDYVFFANDWGSTVCQSRCGSKRMPRPPGDLTGDCKVDLLDLYIIAAEWLNSCDWLNFNCRGGDFDRDGILNLKDFNRFSQHW
ncbi:MAG: hypothetical protein ACYC3B_05290 [Sedimentisphaerales bacterium]